MSPAVLAVVWLLVSLDCALMGYRLAMGRSALLDKRARHRRASMRAALLGQPALAGMTLLAVGLVATGPTGLGAAFDDAMIRLLAVAVPYAAVLLAATALCLVPSRAVRTVATVTIFGPLSLFRPVLVIGAVGYAVLPDPQWPLVLMGALIVIPGVLVEPWIDLRIARRLVLDAASAATAAALAASGAAPDLPRSRAQRRGEERLETVRVGGDAQMAAIVPTHVERRAEEVPRRREEVW